MAGRRRLSLQLQIAAPIGNEAVRQFRGTDEVAEQSHATDFDTLLARGTEAVQENRAEQAVALLRAAVARRPDSAAAQCQLGIACQLAQQNEAALAAFAAALAHAPDMVEALYGLATALNAAGQPEAALARFDTLLALAPGLPEAQYGRAAVLQALRRFDAAEAAYAAALALDPEFAEAAAGRAGALLLLGRAEEAVACCEQALGLDPDFVAARCALATALGALHRYREAIAQWHEVLVLAPDHLDARRNLAGTLQLVGRAAEAVEHYQAALPLAAGNAETLADIEAGRAQSLLELGRLEEAEQGFERAIALMPDRTGAHLALVNARKVRPDDAFVAQLEARAARRETLPLGEQIRLCFTMYKVCSDLGQPERGFAFLSEGAALRRGQLAYDEARALAILEAPRSVFTPALLSRHAGQGDPSTLPVFIVGMPRSGSTLIEQMLASHPRVIGGGERSDFTGALRSVMRQEDALRDPDAFIAALSGPVLKRLAAAYLDRLESAAAGTKADPARITDKLLDNFRLAGLIHLALPNARIIHTRRDPVDTCLSCYSKLFQAPHPHTYDLGALGRYWRAYDRLMAHWREVLPAGVMLEVQYETVVDDFEGQARRVVAHCGLEWDDACLAFYETRRPVRTASLVQVRQPIYRTSVGRWRPDADTLRPLLEGLGLAEPAA